MQSNNIPGMPPPPYTSMAPININVPPFSATVGYSAPASLTYGKVSSFEISCHGKE